VREPGADFAVADLHHVFVAGVGLLHGRPLLEQSFCIRILARCARLGELQHGVARAVFLRVILGQHACGLAQLLDLARQPCLFARALLVAAHGLGDLGEIPCARRRHDGRLVGAVARGDRRQAPGLDGQPQLGQPGPECLIQRRDAVIVEVRRLRAEHRHGLGLLAEGLAVSLHLLGDVAQRVHRALAVELVDGDELGEVQHVDLLELAGGAVFGCHHVHRHVDQRHDGRVALADAGCLDDHQIEAGGLAGGDDVGQGGRHLAARIARSQAAHEHARALGPWVDGVHADAVAQQRPARLAPARIDRDQRHAELVILVQAQAADQLVGQARLARAAGAGDAQNGCSGL